MKKIPDLKDIRKTFIPKPYIRQLELSIGEELGEDLKLRLELRSMQL
jgi:hypothetical protein